MSVPTPLTAISSGAAAGDELVQGGASRASISATGPDSGAARLRSARLAAASGLVIGPGTSGSGRWTSWAEGRARSCARSSSGAVTTRACSWLMAWVRALHGGRRVSRSAANHLDLAIAGLGLDDGLSGLDRPGGGLGIERIGLARASPGRPVGAVDLDHDLAVGGQEAGQPSAVAAGALHPPATGSPSRRAQARSWLYPAGVVGIWRCPPGGRAGRGVSDCTSRWVSTPMVSWGATGCACWDGVPRGRGGWHARRPGGQHCEESGRQARIRSRRPVGVPRWPRHEPTGQSRHQGRWKEGQTRATTTTKICSG